MDPRLERARALMREDEEKRSGTNRVSSGDGASYPFWNIPDGSTATVRFLPDKDETNAWFWAERQTLKLPFRGTVGGDSPTDDQVIVTVPCVDMFGDVCPVIAETKPWWKDDSKETIRRVYYKKRSYIAQGFVVASPLEEQNVPENPIRRFMLGKQIIDKLKADMADAEREFFPTDFQNGYDFRIKKTKAPDGKQNAYGTSGLSIRSRPLTEAEMLAMEQYPLNNLADFRGPRPDADGIAAIKAMFHASLAGDPYDFEAFGKYFRPYGSGAVSGTASDAPTGTTLDDSSDEESSSEVKVSEPTSRKKVTTSGGSQADVLATLRANISNRK